MSTGFSNCAVTFTQSNSTVPLKWSGSIGRVTMMRVVNGEVVVDAGLLRACPETKYSSSMYPIPERSNQLSQSAWPRSPAVPIGPVTVGLGTCAVPAAGMPRSENVSARIAPRGGRDRMDRASATGTAPEKLARRRSREQPEFPGFHGPKSR